MINFPGIIVSAISGIPDQYIEWNKEENIVGTVFNEKVESALRRMELMEDYTCELPHPCGACAFLWMWLLRFVKVAPFGPEIFSGFP
jgi:hypothetical protein